MSTLAQRITDLATRISTECKSLRTLINGNAVDLAGLQTTAKGNLVAALNEVLAYSMSVEDDLDALIDDGASDTVLDKTYSASKIVDLIGDAINALTNGAPGALDQLNEFAAALGNDADFAATMTAALAARVRFDAVQTLTTGQKQQARQNIDAYGSAEIGNPDTDFVTTFTTGLV